MKKLGRRVWLTAGGVTALGIPLGAWLAWGHDPEAVVGPRGALRPDPDGVFDLLEGFRYQIVDRSGERMGDGYRVPPRPDGMACFSGAQGALVLVRNHELPVGYRQQAIGRHWPREAYDPEGAGAVTRVVLDPETLEVRSRGLLLAGTSMNCSGGPSPWGWISCEEDTQGSHGFAFLCDHAAPGLGEPQRIDGYGRFRHEAAAVTPETAVCYLSEDQTDSCVYRFVPHDPSSPFEGTLQALRVRGRDAENTAPLRAGAEREIDWVDLADPTPPQDDLRHQAQRLGAAVFRRGEGICPTPGGFYVASTTGGPIEAGQIFRVHDEPDGGTLEVVAASEDRAQMDMPDNLTCSPTGMLYFAEDGQGHDHLRFVHPGGAVHALGRNAASEGEIAGVCFSPDGETLLCNLQEEGLTLAIRGPFAELSG